MKRDPTGSGAATMQPSTSADPVVPTAVRRQPGKMQRRHRQATYWLLGLCFGTGLVWCAGLDVLRLPAPALKPWWIAHGCASILALLPVGAALAQHVIATWRARRNVAWGVALVAGLALLLASALALLYGPEDWHDGAHWLHAIVGILVAAVFPLHVWRGRRAVGRGAA